MSLSNLSFITVKSAKWHQLMLTGVLRTLASLTSKKLSIFGTQVLNIDTGKEGGKSDKNHCWTWYDSDLEGSNSSHSAKFSEITAHSVETAPNYTQHLNLKIIVSDFTQWSGFWTHNHFFHEQLLTPLTNTNEFDSRHLS